MPCLLKMIKDKGHTYQSDIELEKKKEEKGAVIKKKELIFNAEDIDREQLDKIIKNEQINIDSREDYYKKEKMLYKIKWHFEKTGMYQSEFEQVYNMNNVLTNYLLTKIEKKDRKVDKSELFDKIKFEKVDIINNMISIVKDGNCDLEKINKIINSKKYKVLFNNKKEAKNCKSIKAVNSIINNYGYEITSDKKNKKVDKKVITTYDYAIKEIKIIRDYKERLRVEKEIDDYEYWYNYHLKQIKEEVNNKLNEVLPYQRITDDEMKECDNIYNECLRVFGF
jgi:hypothetical protein